MKRRIVSVPGSVQAVWAREALMEVPGVVAAELIPGAGGVRVYCADEVSQSRLEEAARGGIFAKGME